MDLASILTAANGFTGSAVWLVTQWFGSLIKPYSWAPRAMPVAPILVGLSAGAMGFVDCDPNNLKTRLITGAFVGLLTSSLHQLGKVTVAGKTTVAPVDSSE